MSFRGRPIPGPPLTKHLAGITQLGLGPNPNPITLTLILTLTPALTLTLTLTPRQASRSSAWARRATRAGSA